MLCVKKIPMVSHMGGVWKRHIRSARIILLPVMKTQGVSASLNEESLATLFVEVENTITSRSLTVETINVNSEVALSPSHILTMKYKKLVMLPPGVFGGPDLYCRRRWRRVPHISNEFWSPWRKEFLASLQEKQKWIATRRNFCMGDIMILKDASDRSDWRLARVNDNGYVQRKQTEKSCVGASDTKDSIIG